MTPSTDVRCAVVAIGTPDRDGCGAVADPATADPVAGWTGLALVTPRGYVQIDRIGRRHGARRVHAGD
ncbi:MAG: hypothetical protein ABI137_10265 [Antricoccus sp.]